MHTSATTAAYQDQPVIGTTQAAGKAALFLCRTPLQARICLRIIELEKLEKADVLYFTQDDNESDRLYFSLLKKAAGNTQYLYITHQRFDILNHLKAYLATCKVFKRSHYQTVFLACVDSPYFKAILKQHKAARLCTFDDGTSNIIENWYISYHHDNEPGRLRFYNALAGLDTRGKIKARSARHYSIYKGFKNICPPEKTCFLEIFPSRDEPTGSGPDISFFIGQPFHEYLSPDKMTRLKRFLANHRMDFYVSHPREATPLDTAIPILTKHGELAEVAIMRESPQGKPSIYASFSTVLFNIPKESANKYYLHFGDDDSDQEMLELAVKAGCEVIEI